MSSRPSDEVILFPQKRKNEMKKVYGYGRGVNKNRQSGQGGGGVAPRPAVIIIADSACFWSFAGRLTLPSQSLAFGA